MKKLVVIIGLLLLVAGGGGAGWWFFLREDPVAAARTPANAEDVDGATLANRYVDLDPFIIPLLREGQVIQHLTVVLTVELVGPVPVDDLPALMPRLRDAILRELHGLFAFRHIQEAGPDAPIVKQRLLGAAEEVFGPGAVKAVLIKSTSKRVPGSA